jgi:dolichol-phosphate mannosyltransferase
MLSVVVPAHNAEDFIEKTINELRTIKDAEIIVVCNNCRDNTYGKVEGTRKKVKNIINLNFPFYTGKGGAILRGISVARGGVIGFVDADNAFRVSDIKKAAALTKKYDCVIGSKWKGMYFSKIRQPLKRRMYGRIWNLLVRILFGLDYKDTQAGLKFFRREVIDKIDKRFVCTGFEFDIELLWKIKKAGYSIHELPVNLRKREKSTLWILSTLPMLWNLMKLRIK